MALYAALVDGTVAHEPEVFLRGTPDDCSVILSLCIKSVFFRNSDHCPLGSPGVAVTSPLLFALHAGSFGVWARECASCASVKYLKREKDFSNRLSVLFPNYISLPSAEKRWEELLLLICAQQKTALCYTVQLGRIL